MELIRGNDIDIKIGDETICYNDLGNSEIPIIFIHGFPLNKESWNSQLDFLKNSIRVIAYDIRGFGKSKEGKDELSIHLFADDLINFMDALQIKKAIICGLSMGGYIVLNAVQRYKERFEALILMDTQCNADTSDGKEKRLENIKQIKSDGLTDFANNSVKNLFSKGTFENNLEITENVHQTILHTSSEVITGTLRALAERQETCDDLYKISLFTLILCGREDIITPLPKAEFLNTNIKNSTLHIIENAGHLSNLENPVEVNQHILKFVTTTLTRF